METAARVATPAQVSAFDVAVHTLGRALVHSHLLRELGVGNQTIIQSAEPRLREMQEPQQQGPGYIPLLGDPQPLLVTRRECDVAERLSCDFGEVQQAPLRSKQAWVISVRAALAQTEVAIWWRVR